ncbi:hypothetical protein [Enterovirga aerilata]|uniref:Uncharacterized protein n=1 Tax=Enterovirga aerilata TaxID=2730920 RepID=A0A849IBI6_9HYPH|nr:hypothetical protein [Enterovirga sp. DB1703]NNM74768.1 hypothetical protein [Enterovirga sp. DB1703]
MQDNRSMGCADERTPKFIKGDKVVKFTGEARWFGEVRDVYWTKRGSVRYVVEVEPQGFQMIAAPSQLRAAEQGESYLSVLYTNE